MPSPVDDERDPAVGMELPERLGGIVRKTPKIPRVLHERPSSETLGVTSRRRGRKEFSPNKARDARKLLGTRPVQTEAMARVYSTLFDMAPILMERLRDGLTGKTKRDDAVIDLAKLILPQLFKMQNPPAPWDGMSLDEQRKLLKTYITSYPLVDAQPREESTRTLPGPSLGTLEPLPRDTGDGAEVEVGEVQADGESGPVPQEPSATPSVRWREQVREDDSGTDRSDLVHAGSSPLEECLSPEPRVDRDAGLGGDAGRDPAGTVEVPSGK